LRPGSQRSRHSGQVGIEARQSGRLSIQTGTNSGQAVRQSLRPCSQAFRHLGQAGGQVFREGR
jgi:hypothetical protein